MLEKRNYNPRNWLDVQTSVTALLTFFCILNLFMICMSDLQLQYFFVNMKAIFAVMNTTYAVVKIRPEKYSGLYGM